MLRFKRASTLCVLSVGAVSVGLGLQSCGVMASGDCTERASCPADDAVTFNPVGDAEIAHDGSADAAFEAANDGAFDGTSEAASDASDSPSDAPLDASEDEAALGSIIADASRETGVPDASMDVLVADVTTADVATADVAMDVGPEAPGPGCNPLNPFGAPVLVPGIESTSTEGGLRLTPDERTAYFWSTRPGGPGSVNLYVTTRADANSTFGNIVLLNNVNATGTQYDPTVTGDDLTLAFASDRATDGGTTDLFWAARAAATSDFSAPTALAAFDTASNDEEPFLLPNGSEMYFASDRTGTFGIYRALATANQFGAPIAVAELNTGGGVDVHPAVSADDLAVLFSSTRTGGQGNNDIWLAERTSTTAAFGAPVNLTTVNTTAKEIPDWLSADHCRLYFHSDRSGAPHEYLAVRP